MKRILATLLVILTVFLCLAISVDFFCLCKNIITVFLNLVCSVHYTVFCPKHGCCSMCIALLSVFT